MRLYGLRLTRAPVRLYGFRLTHFTRVRRDSHHDALSCHAGDGTVVIAVQTADGTIVVRTFTAPHAFMTTEFRLHFHGYLLKCMQENFHAGRAFMQENFHTGRTFMQG